MAAGRRRYCAYAGGVDCCYGGASDSISAVHEAEPGHASREYGDGVAGGCNMDKIDILGEYDDECHYQHRPAGCKGAPASGLVECLFCAGVGCAGRLGELGDVASAK